MTDNKRKHVHLTASQWGEAAGLYESGGATLDQLARMYGVAKRTIQRRFKSDGVVKGRKGREVAVEAAKRVAADAALTPDDLACLIRREKNRSLEINENIREQIIETINHDPEDIGATMRANARLRNLDLATKALGRVHADQRRLLGMDNEAAIDGELPELVFRIVSDEDIRAETEARFHAMKTIDGTEIAPLGEEMVT
jgi:AcrR family transcriptional regulator